MTRVRVVLLTVAYLLTGASAAAAECAWVLWVETTSHKYHHVAKAWEVGLSASSEARCAEMRATKVSEHAAKWRIGAAGKTLGEPGSVRTEQDSVTMFTASGYVTIRYVCLPDTVDPRTAKTT